VYEASPPLIAIIPRCPTMIMKTKFQNIIMMIKLCLSNIISWW